MHANKRVVRARCRGISRLPHCICDVSGDCWTSRLGKGWEATGRRQATRNDWRDNTSKEWQRSTAESQAPGIQTGGSATKPMASTPIVKPPAKDSPFFLRHVSVSRWESFAVNTDIRRYVNERNRAINDYSQYTCRVSFLVQLPHSLIYWGAIR